MHFAGVRNIFTISNAYELHSSQLSRITDAFYIAIKPIRFTIYRTRKGQSRSFSFFSLKMVIYGYLASADHRSNTPKITTMRQDLMIAFASRIFETTCHANLLHFFLVTAPRKLCIVRTADDSLCSQVKIILIAATTYIRWFDFTLNKMLIISQTKFQISN